jgi:hypothetical protein
MTQPAFAWRTIHSYFSQDATRFLSSLGVCRSAEFDPCILLPPTGIFDVVVCLRASFVVHTGFDVSVGIQRYENDAPLPQDFKLLGRRALARISSGFVVR